MFNIFKFFQKKITEYNYKKFHLSITDSSLKKSKKIFKTISFPERFILPITGNSSVKEGDYVLREQPISYSKNLYNTTVHAPTSGTIEKIQYRIIPNISGELKKCIFIIPDKKDYLYKKKIITNYYNFSSNDFVEKMYKSGINFLNIFIEEKINIKKILKSYHTLIINFSEDFCFFYNNFFLKRNYKEIFNGINIISYFFKIKKIIFTIYYKNTDCISIIKKKIKYNSKFHLEITLKKLFLSNNFFKKGILVQDIYTLYAINKTIIKNKIITDRIITIINQRNKIKNLLVRIGTPVSHFLDCVNKKKILVISESMQKFFISSFDFPILSTTNYIIDFQKYKNNLISFKEESCINCDACEKICPVNLSPKEMYWSILNKYDYKIKFSLKNCIDCNACTYVCPSNIPLLKYFQEKRKKIKNKIYMQKIKNISRKRFIEKKNRLSIEKILLESNSIEERKYKKLVYNSILRVKSKRNIKNKLKKLMES